MQKSGTFLNEYISLKNVVEKDQLSLAKNGMMVG